MLVSSDRERVSVLRIKSEIIRVAGEFLRGEGFIEILPVLLSPVTDPLCHETYDGVVDFYGVPYRLMKSMIFHKQAALRVVPRIFCFAPNVRMEPPERAAAGRYLAEFVQLDLEVREASRDDVIALGERLVRAVFEAVAHQCAGELASLGRSLPIPSAPFERIRYADAAARYGEPFDDGLSRDLAAPAWIIDFPQPVREFYDREDPKRPGVLLDMDLVYPEGYGEALSGGEREYELERILDRMSRDGIQKESYGTYLSLVHEGIPASAGFGIGIERLTRYVAGLDRIEQARLFPKVPGDIRAM